MVNWSQYIQTGNDLVCSCSLNDWKPNKKASATLGINHTVINGSLKWNDDHVAKKVIKMFQRGTKIRVINVL